MVRALVTGGAGFVGRHLCGKLISEGVDVVCVDKLARGTGAMRPAEWPNPPKGGFSLIEEDCRRYFDRADDRFDMVFHLAAMVGGRVML
jgi:nucleoside-diphosphate-sugar epimerase